MYDTVSKLYNEVLGTYFDEWYDLSDAKRSKVDYKYDPINLTPDPYDYEECYKEESDNSTVKDDKEELDDLPQLGSYEEVKEGKELKISTPNKLLTRFLVSKSWK